MSHTVPSNRPLSPDRPEDLIQEHGPTQVFPFLRPPARDDEIGRLSNYRVLRLLAEGGMGKVYLAEDIALGRAVALKVLQPHLEQSVPGSFERFLREARALASIKHDNLVTVYAAGQDMGTVYMAMELLDGETLDTRLNRDGALPPAEVRRIGREIAVGLAAVHERGLIHRDIKPANLWLEAPSGRVKILDFGLVRGTEGDRGLTQSGMVVGTPAYLSPEQVRGGPYDTRADLFSLGCVLYRMCTNQSPFPAATPIAQLTAVIVDEAADVSDLNPAVPPDLAALVMQLIEKDPDRRPASAAAVAEHLAAPPRVPEPEPELGPEPVRKRVRAKYADRDRRTPATVVARRPAAGRPVWFWAALVAALVIPLVAIGVVALRGPNGGRKDERRDDPIPETVAARKTERVSEVTPPKQPQRVYLNGLEREKAVNWPFPGPLPPGVSTTVMFRDQPRPHGIFMHPSPPGEFPSSITYRLARAFSRLSGQVAFNDSAPGDPPPAVFAVYADGKPAWRSRELDRRDQVEAFDIDVTGVNLLKIEATAPDEPMGCHCAWIDPVLTK